MCGISGIISNNNIYYDLYESLFHLQHRGQDSCGMVLSNEYNEYNEYKIIKKEGLVKNINEKIIEYYKIGLGHIRYKTNGELNLNQIQPFIYENYILIHNGNIYNLTEIEQYINDKFNESISYVNDSDLLLKLFYFELLNKNINQENIENALINISNICKGSYSIIIYIKNYGFVIFKDKYGIRPLCYGKNNNGYIICSESIAIDNLEYKLIDEINSGEMIIIKENLELYKKQYINSHLNLCIFEYIYISRPESIINNVNVYDVRLKLGEYLSTQIINNISSEDLNEIDYIIPIPKTSNPVALMISEKLKIPYREGIMNNRYIDRTFIMNNQYNRKKNIRLKMSVVKNYIENKNIIIVDDSIVRGNTIKHIIDLLKKNKVGKIYVCVSSAPIKYKNIYGIDIPTNNELIANNFSIDEIEKKINADKLIYLNIEDMINSIKYYNNNLNFDLSIFNGNYII